VCVCVCVCAEGPLLCTLTGARARSLLVPMRHVSYDMHGGGHIMICTWVAPQCCPLRTTAHRRCVLPAPCTLHSPGQMPHRSQPQPLQQRVQHVRPQEGQAAGRRVAAQLHLRQKVAQQRVTVWGAGVT